MVVHLMGTQLPYSAGAGCVEVCATTRSALLRPLLLASNIGGEQFFNGSP